VLGGGNMRRVLSSALLKRSCGGQVAWQLGSIPRRMFMLQSMVHRQQAYAESTVSSTSFSSTWRTLFVTLPLTTTALALGYYYVTDTRSAALQKHVLMPLFRMAYPDAEDSHHAAVWWMKVFPWLLPRDRVQSNQVLQVEVY
jgi:dihydroorotate dehydrogenase